MTDYGSRLEFGLSITPETAEHGHRRFAMSER